MLLEEILYAANSSSSASLRTSVQVSHHNKREFFGFRLDTSPSRYWLLTATRSAPAFQFFVIAQSHSVLNRCLGVEVSWVARAHIDKSHPRRRPD